MSEKTLIEWNTDVGTRFLTIHPDGSFDIDKDAPPLFVIGELAKAFIRQQDRIKRLEDCAETAWGVIANVDSGNWGEQRSDWREAAIRWRDDQFHPAFGLTKHKAKEAKP
jgi:hypothetical protein